MNGQMGKGHMNGQAGWPFMRGQQVLTIHGWTLDLTFCIQKNKLGTYLTPIKENLLSKYEQEK